MIYFTSDLHFYHGNVISFAGRPFQDAEEMNRALIQNWNAAVQPEDEIYILGDVTMRGPEKAMEVLRQLKGRKYLIRGNHDRFADRSSFDASLFEWVRDYCELSWQKQDFVLFHYPILEWNGQLYGSVHLHGHQHNRRDYNLWNQAHGIRKYDVGVDANGMRPVSLSYIWDFFALGRGDWSSVSPPAASAQGAHPER